MDMNGAVDTNDIPLYVNAVLDPETYYNQRQDGTIGSADMNLDGVLDGKDTQGFVNIADQQSPSVAFVAPLIVNQH